MKLFRPIVKRLMPQANHTYAQFGEDLILSHLFSKLNINKPTYLDIGANEPRYISNTYYFYQRGSRGVLVEPNPHLYKKLKRIRPHDIVLNTGIGFSEISEADFYVFPDYANGLSTFSEKEARHWEITGMKGMGKIKVEKVIKMPLTVVNTILEKYFKNTTPDFISLDVEGLDLEILKSMNFEKFQPMAICVETMAYDEHQQTFKIKDIAEFMLTQNYVTYADTRVNTIFCRKDILNI